MKKQDKISKHSDRIGKVVSDHKKMTAAVRKAVREALKEHRQAGNPVATIKKGKVVWVEA